MKKLSVFIFFIAICVTNAQEKNSHPFFTTDFNLTFGINENYELGNNNDEAFIVPTATLLRFGFGYEFYNRIAVSFNTGFDYHFRYSIMSIPAYVGVRYNIWKRGDQEALFLKINAGKMWRPAERFSDGDYKAFGVGWRLESAGRWTPTLKFMFHRKKIKNFKNGNLDSFSIGFGVMFY